MDKTEFKGSGVPVLTNEKKDLIVGGNVVFNNPSNVVKRKPIKLNI